MITRGAFPGVFLVLLSVAQPVEAQAPRQIAGWNLSAGDKSCALYQTIDDRFFFLALSQDGSGMLRAHDKRWKLKKGKSASFVFPGETPLRIEGVVASTSNGWSGLVAKGGNEVVRRLSKTGPVPVAIESGGMGVATMSFEGLGEAVPFLIDCANKLPAHGDAPDQIARRARLTTTLTISRSDLLAGAKQLNELVFRMVVGVNGVATDCQVIQSTGSEEIDQRACALLKQQMHFKPAQDASGEPVVTTYQSRISFP